jgi:hypothetical protein
MHSCVVCLAEQFFTRREMYRLGHRCAHGLQRSSPTCHSRGSVSANHCVIECISYWPYLSQWWGCRMLKLPLADFEQLRVPVPAGRICDHSTCFFIYYLYQARKQLFFFPFPSMTVVLAFDSKLSECCDEMWVQISENNNQLRFFELQRTKIPSHVRTEAHKHS